MARRLTLIAAVAALAIIGILPVAMMIVLTEPAAGNAALEAAMAVAYRSIPSILTEVATLNVTLWGGSVLPAWSTLFTSSRQRAPARVKKRIWRATAAAVRRIPAPHSARRRGLPARVAPASEPEGDASRRRGPLPIVDRLHFVRAPGRGPRAERTLATSVGTH